MVPTITMPQTPCRNQGEADTDITLVLQKPVKHHPGKMRKEILLGNVHTQSMDVMFSDLHYSTFHIVQ